MKSWRELSGGLRALTLASVCLNVVLVTYIGIQWFASNIPAPGVGMPLRMIERVSSANVSS